jgi:glyoxylase-like metal-dependent hydrolase (beta-lactamase superfamily II)
MNAHVYRFRVGTFECAIVNDGTFFYPHPAQIFFDDVPAERLTQVLQEHEIDPAAWETYPSPYPSLLVKTGNQIVLVDTGAGGLAPTTGQLLPNLRSLDVAPEEIDIVILTHGHVDHIGGNLDQAGKLAFPNARYVMGRAEWDFWAADPDLAAFKVTAFIDLIRSVARTQLPPIQERLTLVEDGDEIVPGIQIVAAPGHTPGHIALRITSNGEQLLWAVDTCIHPIHVEQPDWVSMFDYWPHETVVTRRKLLGQAAVDAALVHLYHFPFPGLGHVVLYDGGWRWQPLISSTFSATTL